MSLPVYRCSSDLPAVLCEVLSSRPEFEDATINRVVESGSDPDDFRFLISRGGAEAHVFGGRDQYGVHLFIVGGTMNPLKWMRSGRLLQDTQRALVEIGIREMSADEIERLDARAPDNLLTNRPNKSE
jgi:hypothetical protein